MIPIKGIQTTYKQSEKYNIFFARTFSNNMPVGIETTPYAIKSEKGSKETSAKLILKSFIKSGIILPIIFVIIEIFKKHIKIIQTNK